jgi:hypothetical protein
MRVSEIDVEVASGVAGSLLWARLQHAGLVPDGMFMVDLERAFDLQSVCQEHGIKPDVDLVTSFLTQMVVDNYEFLREDGELVTDEDIYDVAYEMVYDLLQMLPDG